MSGGRCAGSVCAIAGLVVSRFLPVEARLVRFVTLAAPLSVAYLGLDALLERTARTRLMEASAAGLPGLALRPIWRMRAARLFALVALAIGGMTFTRLAFG